MAERLTLDFRVPHPGFALEMATSVPGHGITALFGPSGSGKTTALRAIAGLEPAARGRIAFGADTWLDGARAVPAERRGCGMVFQDQRLFPHLDVAGNLRFAARRAPPLESNSNGFGEAEVIAALDLGPLLKRRTGNLSGGERSRVAVGRTLLSHPRLLLLDEPLAALDQGRKGEILPYLEDIPRHFGLAVILVTHAIDEVAALAERMIVLREGNIAAEGETAPVLERLDLMHLAGRFEAGVVLDTTVEGHDAAFCLTRLALGGQRLTMPMVDLPVGDPVRLRVRARDVMLATAEPAGISARNRLTGRLAELTEEPDTAFAEVVVALEDGQRLRARVTRAAVAELGLAPGSQVWAVVKSVAFDRRGMKGRPA